MKTTIKEITPQWAASVLQTRNPRNRPISVQFVERLSRDIRCGAFATTHQGIAFDENGDLLDGQHRLAAIVKANKPVLMAVTTGMASTHKLNGVSVNTFELLDSGRKRGVGQMLTMAGFKNASHQAAMVRVLVNVVSKPSNFLSITTAQTHKALYYLKSSPSKIAETCSSKSLCRPPSGSLAAFAFWHTVEPEKAEAFVHELCAITGSHKSPSRSLARWLNTHKQYGWDWAIASFKVAASAIYHSELNSNPERLLASDSAKDWLISLNKPLAESLSKIVTL